MEFSVGAPAQHTRLGVPAIRDEPIGPPRFRPGRKGGQMPDRLDLVPHSGRQGGVADCRLVEMPADGPPCPAGEP